ncbi:MAG: TlpA family protein disulfide reductase [Acidobacteria bacterium]|nr:TlpA family protein disulfide reductase [Acidobacteriota bacterium]
MPQFEAVTLAGGRWSGDLEGNVTLINIWATWCTPCRYEIPDLIELKSAWGPKGFEVLGVSVDNAGTAPQIQEFVRNFEINYAVIHDPGMTTLDAFNTTVVPTTVLVDRDGNVRWYHIGPVSSDDPELIDLLTELLGPASPSTTVSF